MNVPANWLEWTDTLENDYYHINVPGELILLKKDFTEWIAGRFCYARDRYIVKDKLTLDDVTKQELKQFYHSITKKDEQLELF